MSANRRRVAQASQTGPTRISQRPLAADRGFGDIHPVLARVYRGRGLSSSAEVDHRLAGLLTPDRLGGIAAAAQRVAAAVRDDERIVVVGDFDADGATGTALAVWALRQMGAQRVEYHVPHRFNDGYGLSTGLAQRLARGGTGILITVDHGVACNAGVEAAMAGGLEVIVTDHHLPGERLPDAFAMVNPNLPGDDFPSKALAGVGVVFYLLAAVKRQLEADGHFGNGRKAPNLADGLDLVALGTVADLVPLDLNNRILVRAGLERMRRSRCRPGLTALLKVSGREPSRISAGDLGFALGPRLNAAGRLEDMAIGIRCLLADDEQTAEVLARELDRLNAERRAVQTEMENEAENVVAVLVEKMGGNLPPGLLVADPGWHAGVVGLVASRMVERFARPVLALAPVDGVWRGSGRSVPGFHLRDALVEVDRRVPGLMQRFGGHAMAAGFTMEGAGIAELGVTFAEVCAHSLGEQPATPEVQTDGPISSTELSLDLAEALAAAGPFGQGFPEPLFDNEFHILGQKLIKDQHLRLTLRHLDGGPSLTGWWFRHGDTLKGDRVRLCYQLEVDEWQGVLRPRLLIRAQG